MLQEYFTFAGKTYRKFQIELLGTTYNVFVKQGKYVSNDSLALSVWDIGNDDPEPFGMLTVNINNILVPEGFACVKNYSENAEWAEKLALQIGGKKTSLTASSGYVDCIPVYDFRQLKIYA